MDKSLMHADRRSRAFELGVEELILFALESGCDVNKFCCPCMKCGRGKSWKTRVVKDHLVEFGIDKSYTKWIWHGELSSNEMSEPEGNSETVEMVQNDTSRGGSDDEEFSVDSDEFLRFVEDSDKPLYLGCTCFTKLNGLVKTYNLKAKHGLSDACYSDMLILIGILLPEGNEGDVYVDATSCPACDISRRKLGKNEVEKVRVPGKVLWYFPPIPRFKKMFQLTKTAKSLTWHDDERLKDDKMRHPADSPNWNSLSSRYSCWLVILVTYNLPPWLCMKRKYMMLTLLISGPKQPGNDIDIYLQPLIDDLKILWDGVEEVYDGYRKQYFKLKAVLFWTINDYPAYGNLFGSIVKGYKACPALAFDDTEEHDLALISLSGHDVLKIVESLNRPFGKKHLHHPYKGIEDDSRPCWKKKSVFFKLEY
ncbi:uncharacterized protein LOC112194663 [Rosa chinensis]|uniref:uncharacterized protein LOC112194663 n=1 Tax=Rosa chinensis TaxID=74649 RepID=UPI000D086E08|nr:uncharacterized protein LOC112194663 [Rosa chinensis]